MKREIPLIITFMMGVIMISAFFIPRWPFTQAEEVFPNWVSIVGSFAIFLGLINLIKIHGNRISRRGSGYGYSAALLSMLFITMFAGFIYGVDKQYSVYVPVNSEQQEDLTKAVTRLNEVGGTPNERLRAIVTMASPIVKSTNPFVIRDALQDFEKSSAEAKKSGKAITKIRVRHPNPYQWIFLFMFSPMQATMFSILAFYIASAAYRAFKAKTRESTLLLTAAFLVMVGRVPIGAYLWGGFSKIAEWIMNIPNLAGQRAILIGAALGIVSTALRIILGIERGYMGGSE